VEIKRSTVIELVIVGLLMFSVSVSVFLVHIWGLYSETEDRLRSIEDNLATLQEQIGRTAEYVAVGNISLKFIPFEREKTVPGTTITYLMGFVKVYNLTNVIVRPITLTVSFTPEVVTPENSTGRITYEYTDIQVLEIPPELDSVDLPWGAFPVKLEGFSSGETVYWMMNVTAKVDWMGNTVTEVSLRVTYELQIR